jgi:hypothetical protein
MEEETAGIIFLVSFSSERERQRHWTKHPAPISN